MPDNLAPKCLILVSFLLLILTSTQSLQPVGVFATRSPFPNVQVGDPSDDWTYERATTYYGAFCRIGAPDGRPLCVDRLPLSAEECKTEDPSTEKAIFPSPDITSVSYTSNGKILNATAWLNYPSGPHMENSTDIPYSFITDENVSQPIFSLYVMDAGSKDLGGAIKEHIERTRKNTTDFRLNENLSGYVNVRGDPAQKVVYTFTGNKTENCAKCVETDILKIKEGKMYLFMFWGQEERYNELIATALNIINSTKIGFQQYENSIQNLQIKYPRDWDRVEVGGIIGFIPPQNRTDGIMEAVRISSAPIENSISLEEYSSTHIDRLAVSLSDFNLTNSSLVSLPGHQAYWINYTYLDQSNVPVAASTILVRDGGRVHIVDFDADNWSYAGLIPLVNEIIDSLRIEERQVGRQNEEMMSSSHNMFTYENSTYRIRLEYPYDWLKDEKDFLPTNPDIFGIISLYSPEGQTFRLSIDHNPNVFESRSEHVLRNNLEAYLNKTIQSYKSSIEDFRLISASSDSWLSDRPAYILEYRYRDTVDGQTIKAQERGIILHHDKVIKAQFFSELDQFSNYLPMLQVLMDSIEFDVPTLKHKDPYFEIEYPYNWTRMQNPYLTILPAGYYSNETEVISYIESHPPIDVPYSILKKYRIDIDYDYSYKRAENTFPFVIEYVASRYQNPDGSSIPPNWTKFIAETQGDKSRIIANSTRDDNGLINEDKGYVFWNINLDSLNLPNQFYITFRAQDIFIKDGQLCTLVDDTDFVGSPPPEYSMILSPGSIQDMRPGEERNVKVEVKTNSTLPFHTTFSANEDDLQLVFEPNNVPGTEGGITTSNLKIKALPNATGNKQHIFSIYASIFLKPTFNPSNASSANITKASDFTLTVLPAKELGDQMNEAWSRFGSSLTGFGGLLATVLAIAGTVGGWILAKRKAKTSPNTNNKKQIDNVKSSPV